MELAPGLADLATPSPTALGLGTLAALPTAMLLGFAAIAEYAATLGHGDFQFDEFVPLGFGLQIVRYGLQFFHALLGRTGLGRRVLLLVHSEVGMEWSQHGLINMNETMLRQCQSSQRRN